jgi:CMP/dCMP kinase
VVLGAKPLIVAIDGPSGVGKSTTSRRVAQALNIPHIDTGAMYRAIGLAALRDEIDTHDERALEELARRVKIEFVPGDSPRVLLNAEDVSSLIRTPEVSMAASDVSTVPAVRRILVRLQQELGRRIGGVLEGRDIGTKVFPDTPYKFFLTATPEVRAKRRYEELLSKGVRTSLTIVQQSTRDRDSQDRERTESPLTEDERIYTVIDTSNRTIDEVVATIVESVRARR